MRVWRSRIGMSVLALSLMALIAACGSDDPTATPTPAAMADDTPQTFEEQWQALIEGAQEEGEIVIVTSRSPVRSHGGAFDEFGEKFGIKVILNAGSARDNEDRILAERSRGRFTIDIVASGTTTTNRLVDAGAIQPLRPLLIHPEILDRSQGWLFEEMFWNDQAQKFLMADRLEVANMVDIYYNTDNVSQAEADSIKGYADLLRPEFKGRIVTLDWSITLSTSRVPMWNALGAEWFDALYKEQAALIMPDGNQRELADGLARGRWDILIPGIPEAQDADAIEGLPLAELTAEKVMSEGLLTSANGVYGVANNAANPHAAQLFINWLHSREGQTSVNRTADPATSHGSLRSDAVQGNLSDLIWARAEGAKALSAEGKLAPPVQSSSPEFAASHTASAEHLQQIYKDLGLDHLVVDDVRAFD